MRIALYIEDGREQIVLTPQTQTEKAILGKLSNGDRDLSIYRGGFYACSGGWTRHTQFSGADEDESTIIVLNPPMDRKQPMIDESDLS